MRSSINCSAQRSAMCAAARIAPQKWSERAAPRGIDVGLVGAGYGMPTAASREGIALMARHDAIFLDPTYTAKAMAGLIARVRRGEFDTARTVLFWHTGGQVGLFA